MAAAMPAPPARLASVSPRRTRRHPRAERLYDAIMPIDEVWRAADSSIAARKLRCWSAPEPSQRARNWSMSPNCYRPASPSRCSGNAGLVGVRHAVYARLLGLEGFTITERCRFSHRQSDGLPAPRRDLHARRSQRHCAPAAHDAETDQDVLRGHGKRRFRPQRGASPPG